MSYSKRPHSPSSSGSPPAKRRAQSPEEGEVDGDSTPTTADRTSKHPFPFNNSTNERRGDYYRPRDHDSWRPEKDRSRSPVARKHRLPPRPSSPPPQPPLQTSFERERERRNGYDRSNGTNGYDRWQPSSKPNGRTRNPYGSSDDRHSYSDNSSRKPHTDSSSRGDTEAEQKEDESEGGLRPLDTPGAPRASERVGIEEGEREEGEDEDKERRTGRNNSRERRNDSRGRGWDRNSSRERGHSRGRSSSRDRRNDSRDRGRDRSRDRGRNDSRDRRGGSDRGRNDSRGRWDRDHDRDRGRRRPNGDAPPPPPVPLPPIDPKLNSVVEDTIARIEREADAAEAAKKKEEKAKVLRLTPDQEMQAYGRKFVGTSQLRDYAILEKLGEGTFGEVHKATHTVTRKVVALKRILMHNEKEGLPVTALREIKILKMLSHPSVVTVCDMVVEASTRDKKGSIYMVFPYMDHDLAGLLENPSVKFSPSQIKLYMRQLLEGTEYLHQNKILHRDLKAANLLINNKGSLQIADFGLARPYSTTNPGWDPRQAEGPWDPLKGGPERGGGGARYTNCVVTRWYRPPELLMGDARYGCAIDMWGVGCIMGEMWTRRPILCGTSDADQLEKIWELCGTPEDSSWPGWRELPGMDGVKPEVSRKMVGRVKQFFSSSTAMDEHGVDLVCKLLILNPATRITAFEALDHDYFWTEPLPCDPSSLPKYVSSHEYDKRKHKTEAHPPAPNLAYPPPPGGFNMSMPPMIPGPGFRPPPGPWGPGPGPNHGFGPGPGPGSGGWGHDGGRGGRGGRGMGRGRGRGGHYHGPPGHNHGPQGHNHGPPGHNHGPPGGHNHGPPGHNHGPGLNGPPVNFSGYVRPSDDRGPGLPPPLGTHSREHRQMRERNMRGRGPQQPPPPPPKPPGAEGDILPYG